MNVTMHTSMPLYPRVEVQPLTHQQLTTPIPTLPLFDQLDLDILEAMLFSSDDEQTETMTHCTASALMCSPSIAMCNGNGAVHRWPVAYRTAAHT
ncbi:hypothetical protein PsorP6_012523 [Peronosclerospora sorghi]|uniref:Uncharacterized protein n=1 Tax=Peronosclerospora sorghi TaxID=230839 RepID=A0ACC0WEP2_9STRA|nr:hypothetical protein PsorP6_012523 [Peronosclerospora sorghi]